MDKSSSDNLSYTEFLQLIREHAVQGNTSRRTKTVTEVYDELCMDFPLVDTTELSLLRDDVLKNLEKSNSAVHPFTKQFVNGLIYGIKKPSNESEVLLVKLI